MPISQLNIGALGGNQGGEVESVSCWAAGDCVAGGGYTWGVLGGGSTAFLASESHGRWRHAFLVPSLDGLAVDQYSEVTWVSCSQSGDCSAGGYYTDDPNAICDSCHLGAFVVNEVSGEWYRAIPIPGLRKLNQGDGASLDAGACAAVGDCQVGGTYSDASNTTQLYTDSESGGVWQIAKELGNFNQFDPRGDPSFATLKCSSVSECVATGTFSTEGTFVAVMHGGVWHLVKPA